MSVYFIESDGFIKIGFSQDVKTRVGNIIKNLRAGGKYLGFMAGDRKVERHLHIQFADDRAYGEWFKGTTTLHALIKSVANPAFPDDERMDHRDRLRQQDERYLDECAGFIRTYFSRISVVTPVMWAELAETIGISVHRLQSIYHGSAEYVTAGEYVVLRELEAAADAVRGSATEAAGTALIEWAEGGDA